MAMNMYRARDFELFKLFQDGWEDVEDDSRLGLRSTSKTDDTLTRYLSLYEHFAHAFSNIVTIWQRRHK